MEIHDVPDALQERLGYEATAGLLQLLGQSRRECVAEVSNLVGDRFERRLVEETSKLRLEMAALRQEMTAGMDALRQEMTTGIGALRHEMTAGIGGLRQEMTAAIGGLRQEMTAAVGGLRQEMTSGTDTLRHEITGGMGALRQEMADQKFDILKWAFLFWVGQFFAVGSLMAVLIRILRPV